MELSTLKSAMIRVLTTTPSMLSPAAKALQRIEAKSPVAERVGIAVLREAILQDDIPDDLKQDIIAILPPYPADEAQIRDQLIQIRITKNEKAYLSLLAAQEANGSISELFRKRMGL